MSGATAFLSTVQVMIMANLYYVIGASGAGKDSLLDYARSQINQNPKVIFAHRYITRPANAGGENHIALDEEEFLSRHAMGCFAMDWYSHDTYYGIGIEVDQWLAKDISVVVNGSRGYLNQAAKRYPELCPVLINVESDVLRKRLLSRGRENKEQIEHRLNQTQKLEQSVSHSKLMSIENNGSLSEAGEKLITIIQKQFQCV